MKLLLLSLMSILLMAAAPASKPAAADPQTAIINKAAEDLAREVDTFLHNPEKSIRKEADYFKDNPSPQVTPEGILRVLERPLNGDPGLQAYVKWQLLSGVPKVFEDKLAARAGNAYVHAPTPAPRPGVTQADQQALNREMYQNQSKMDEVNARYQKQIADFNAAHEPILKYRALLWARLPLTPETLAAGFEDVGARVAAGVRFDDFLDTLLGSARNWVLDGRASPRQLAVMAQVVEKVKNTKPPAYYDKAYVSSKGTPYWKSKTAASADAKGSLTEFLAALREAAGKSPQN
ncbi:MAG TPA: hypothetical protein VH518_09195 [Tepidisphaeraceae bacterium]|jgi:hypothetical protein